MTFPGYNPSMLNNMSPEQLGGTAEMINNMTDDQLRDYARMAGMPNMDPQMMRQSANMMKNMDSGQFQQFQNMAKNFDPSSLNAFQNSGGANNSSSAQNVVPEAYKGIESLKEKGNKHFKAQEYKEASSAYLEAIIEIEEIRSDKKNLRDATLDALEISCRLNYANVKAKEENYEIVLAQSRAVLNIKENGKAYFRLGQALNHFKRYEEAKKNLEKAMNLLPGDETITELYEEVKIKVKPSKTVDDIEEDDYVEEAPRESEDQEEHKNTDYNQDKSEVPKGKMKKKKAPGVEGPNFSEDRKPARKVEEPYDYISSVKNNKSDVKIEEEKVTDSRPTTNSSPFPSGYPPNMSADTMQNARNQLGNMNPDQMNMMSSYFKNMDNSSLKGMLKSMMGTDISDAQLDSMKSMMTPEMLQSVSKMDMSNMRMPGSAPAFQAPVAGNTTGEQSAMPSFPGGMPGMGAGNPLMDIKPDQVNTMFDMMINNPEMLKNMVGMLGENHPISGFIKNRKPEELAKYLKAFKGLFKVYTKVSPLISFIRRHWQIFAGLLVGYIFYRTFG